MPLRAALSTSSRVTGPVPANQVQLLAANYSGSGSYGSSIPAAWRHTTGAGSVVALIDDGFDPGATSQYGNFSTALSRYYFTDPSGSGSTSIFNGSIGEPSGGFHGTTTSGLIGATGNLGGPVGVAPDATIVGVKVTFGNGSFQPFVDALTYASMAADIVNNSWGFTGYGTGEPSSWYFAPWYAAVQNAVVSGRSGLGSVIVFAAGNDAEGANSLAVQPINADPRVIAVAGSRVDGTVTWYSTPGSALLVSAISDNLLVPSPGTNQSNFESGTSYAAPTISGIAALILSVNPTLGWRDVQEILVDSAYTPNPGAFVTNRAGDWNGGGRNFSNQLGFGVVDASVAVDLASVWTGQSTSANLVTTTVNQAGSLAIGGGQTASSSVGFVSALRVQHVQVTIDDPNFASGPNATASTLEAAFSTLVLISPWGTRSVLLNQAGLVNGVDKTGGLSLSGDIITSNAFWGENSAGTWTLTATDTAGQSAILADWSLTVWGDQTATVAAPLVFTPSFAMLAAGDPTRANIVPAATGATTIDLIDLPGPTTLNLNGGPGLIDGVAVTLAAGLRNLNDAGSTGNLTVRDAAGGSTLSGGLGTNVFYVSNAADIIITPAGSGVSTVYASVNYTLTQGAVVKYLRPGNTTANLTLTGNGLGNVISGAGTGHDTLVGGAGNTVFVSGIGVDAMVGGSLGDTFYVNNSSDSVMEQLGGTATVCASVSFTVQPTAGVKYLRACGNASSLTLTGGSQTTVITGAGAGRDTLIGLASTTVFVSGTGIDTMIGGGMSDSFYVNNSADTVTEQPGGAAAVYASVDYTVQPTANVKYLRANGGAASLTLTGGSKTNIIVGTGTGNDTLIGNAATTTLVSGAGIDTMIGGGINDTFIVNNSSDIVSEPLGGKTSVITSVNFILPSDAAFRLLQAASTAVGLTLTGNGLGDTVVGGPGGDTLVDVGADRLVGGSGATDFVYASQSVAAVGTSGQDIVTNFSTAQGDKIDLHFINAINGAATTQIFDFIGTNAFDGQAGELRYQVVGANTLITADTAGTRAANFAIQLNGIHSLAATDFVL